MDKLSRAKARGAVVTTIPKKVDVTGLSDMVGELKAVIEAQRQSNELIASAIENLAIATRETGQPIDLEAIKAILPEPVQMPVCEPVSWTVEFERDQRQLMIPGTVRFIPSKRVQH